MKQPEEVKAALYMRLSRANKDDSSSTDESGSIETQRMILRQYVAEQGFFVVDEYVDDGWSGTNFDRPGFQRMMADIEAGKVNCVITKDLSRLGRESTQMGMYLDFTFANMGVRYIAIAEGVDTINGLSDIVPIHNYFNEFHAKNTSVKVKNAFQAKFRNGERISTYAPIGYIKDPEQPNHLIIDEENRWIVEKMFDMAAHGAGAAKIQRCLIAEKVPTPAWISYQRNGAFAHVFRGKPEEKWYLWTIAEVRNILKDETYIGNTVHRKHGTVSFKNKKRITRPEDEWIRVEGTQEAIISIDMFELVQQLAKQRHREQKDQTTQIFSGLLRCADCDWAMRSARSGQRKKPYHYFCCIQYDQMGKTVCTMHYIRYDVLYPYVLSRLQYWAAEAQQDPEKLLQKLLHEGEKEFAKANKKAASELKQAQKRLNTVDNMYSQLYENHVSGLVNERNFKKLSEQYQQEQDELEARITELSEQLEREQQDSNNAQKWIALIKQYTDLQELTAEVLNTLIEKIVVHEAVKSPDGSREQEVEIFYRFVGKIDG